MTETSDYLEQIITKKNRTCNMQVVFVDIVSYSKRTSQAQIRIIDAFMNSLEEAITETAKHFLEYSQNNRINFKTDIIKLPSGDGVAVGFPFDGIPDIHLFFAKELTTSIHKNNMNEYCPKFNKQGWCNCHKAFNLRMGISEGKSILYKDINGNYNIAGKAINIAARVMGIADSNQIVFTKYAYEQLVDMNVDHEIDQNFIKYKQIKIKHDLQITVYQYVDDSLDGLNSSLNETLELEEKAINNDETEVEELESSIQNTVAINVRMRDKTLQSKVTSKAKRVSTQDKLLNKEMKDHMSLIPAGKFLMGDKKTGQVKVTITKPFMVDKYLVTQALYQKVMNNNPSRFNEKYLPVENINWFDAIKFCNELSKKFRLEEVYEVDGKKVKINYKNNGYRLPTEAEWEYSCRGKTTGERYGKLDDIAWYSKNSEKQTKRVGQKLANNFGLYDMLGNVWEWCNDWYNKEYPKEPQKDPIGPEDGLHRVLRGGSWANFTDNIRSAHRNRKDPSVHDNNQGIRLFRSYISK